MLLAYNGVKYLRVPLFIVYFRGQRPKKSSPKGVSLPKNFSIVFTNKRKCSAELLIYKFLYKYLETNSTKSL